MKTIIKNATVVLPTGSTVTSVLIDGQTIAEIDPAIQIQADEVIDASGLALMPGVIDSHVHFREPGLTHKEDLASASRACAVGGVTSFLEMPNTIPNAVSQTRILEKLELGGKHSLVNYGFYIGATRDNIEELKNATRTPGIKIFIGSSTGDLLVDEQSVLERIFAETSLPICAHCEDETTVLANEAKYAGATDVAVHSKVRNHEAAIIATQRAIDLSTRHQHPFHVLHVSTVDEVPLIAAAPDWVTGEVCPHHLFFNIDDYGRLGALVKMNPAIKTAADNEGLWQALRDGKITMVVTDHAPHTLEEKQQPYPACPSGLPAVENSLALMLNQVANGRCSIEQVVSWMCSEPARVWNIRNKGRIEVGFDADFALVDLNKTNTIRNQEQQSKAKWSPWDGTTLTGWPVATWVMGRQVFDDRQNQCEFDSTQMGSEILFDR